MIQPEGRHQGDELLFVVEIEHRAPTPDDRTARQRHGHHLLRVVVDIFSHQLQMIVDWINITNGLIFEAARPNVVISSAPRNAL